MVVIRNQLASVRSGGRRQFSEVRDRLMLVIESDGQPILNRLEEIGLESKELNNAPVVIAQPRNTIKEVLEIISSEEETDSKTIRKSLDELTEVAEQGSVLTGPSEFTLRATQQLARLVSGIDGVRDAQFVNTLADYGPENLRVEFGEIPSVGLGEAKEIEGNLGQLNESLGLDEAWEVTRGENVTIAVFDTGFAKGIIGDDRVVDTFHGDSVDSVYAPAEGHGTMTAGASAASKDDGLPFNGSAPGADVILVRITDNEGQIRSDIIAEAWDWLMDRRSDKPIVTNHSYGTPICSGRPRTKFCDTPENEVITIANSKANITSVYAAGNEAMTCGHRLVGFTNAITGTNSLEEVIAVGALLTDGRDAQRYSSHGRGDCSPISDPKPNVSSAIPRITYYGTPNGWELKDMSTGLIGSSGGTSHAAPTTAGMVALLQSAAVENNGGPLETEEIKQILRDHSEPPRRTQVNSFGLLFGQEGYDARFGHGQLNINSALEEVTS